MKVYEKAPAKINLLLNVLAKRKDGYHEVEMIMTMIDLADRLQLQMIPENKIVIASQVNCIPLDKRNLAFQAAKLVKERYHIKQGVYIYLDKHIPVAAGLAGGSSNAAAVLRGLNKLWQLNMSVQEMQKLGEELGSDVPFCVTGGTAIARGRGERLEKIISLPQCWVIIAKPPINVATVDIYRRLRIGDINGRPSLSNMITAIHNQNFREICKSLENVLEEVTLSMHPAVKKIKNVMKTLGAEGVLMSGSGPTVFGLVSKQTKIARIYNGIRGFCKEVYAVRML